MGYARYDEDQYRSYSHTHSLPTASRDEVFQQQRLRRIHQSLDPKGVRIRESRDSDQNPVSTPLILGIDVSGSMGILADHMVRDGANRLATQLYERRPIADPHIMFASIGDLDCDEAPLQVSQFEADIKIIEQLRRMWLEGGGGGNMHESYTLAWYFAAHHTAIDSFEKRDKKGYLFTAGDECINPDLPLVAMEQVLGYRPQGPLRAEELFRQASEKWEIFHLMVEEGDYYKGHARQVRDSWRGVIGDRAIRLPDHTKMAEVIMSIIQIREDREAAPVNTILNSWDADTNRALSRVADDFGRLVDLR